jgi:hypothetical protein
VFLHAAVLEGAGHSTVEPGTKLSVPSEAAARVCGVPLRHSCPPQEQT